MGLLINDTEIDVPGLINRIQELIAKPVRRDNIEDFAEIAEQLEELHGEVQDFESNLQLLIEAIDEVNGNYETWEDDENDRETRMDAREEIENASSEIDGILGYLDAYVEER